ncbi:MAG: PspC domain-containing protein [Chloroflexi bacterium]|nr:PspC domain-containing protein [Chloroflexota bacterium]
MEEVFYRDRSKGIVAGVCAGLAEYFHVSPVLVRLIFVLVALAGGPAVLAYILLWIVLPERAAIGSPHRATVRDNVREIGAEARGLSQELQAMFGGKHQTMNGTGNRVIWLGAILIVIGLVLLVDSLHLLSWFRLDLLWAIALILAGIVLLNRALRRS